MTEQERAVMQQALEALEWHLDRGVWGSDTEGVASALRAALAQEQANGSWHDGVLEGQLRERERWLAQQPEPVTDPFADIRDKRMGELNMEQRDRATELWLREQIGPREDYWYPHLQTLFRIIDRLREQAEPVQKPVAWNWMLDGRPYGQVYYGNPPDADIVERAAISGRTVRLLYTTPQPQRPPLTDEEIEDIWNRYCDELGEASINDAIDIARAVERAVRGEAE